MSDSTRPAFRGLRHVGIQSSDPAALAAFYQDVLGMQVVGGSPPGGPFGASAFLSSRPDQESHEIAIFTSAAFRHLAFKVASLQDLRAAYGAVAGRGVGIKAALNHGVSLAFYFDDPDGNMVEIYWPTGLEFGQPYGHPIDLTQREEALLQDVANLARRQGLAWSPPDERA